MKMISAILLLTTASAFDLAIAQNFPAKQKAGATIKFDLYNPNGGTVPSSTESYDVTLLDGTANKNDAKTVATLLKGITKTKGISVTLPGSIPTGEKYFFGLVAKGDTKYSGFFQITGDARSSTNTTTSVPAPTATVLATPNTKGADSSASVLQFMLAFIGINLF